MRLGKIRWLACAVFLTATAAAFAQAYPSKPIRLILPVPPGGVADVIARPLALKLTQSFGQSVVIDNRPGATGAIGITVAAKSAPDGYTLLWGSTNTLIMGPAFYGKPLASADFAPITPVINFPNVLVVHPSVAANSVAELIDLAKARPGALRFASAGTGSINHLVAGMFQTTAKVKITHVPYKGGGPALIDVLGGHVDALFATGPSAVTYVKEGKLKGLLITSTARIAALPNVPSAKEAGLPDLVLSTWNGILAPAGTPQPIVRLLNKTIISIVNTPDMSERMAAQAGEAYTTTPEQYAAIIKNDFAKWSKVVKDTGIRAEE
jgi:tripartite-type tricarboxylate transporter receptor subunit TctC